MADTTETTASSTSHMTCTQAPAVCNKNIFDLFYFNLQVEPVTHGLKNCSQVL